MSTSAQDQIVKQLTDRIGVIKVDPLNGAEPETSIGRPGVDQIAREVSRNRSAEGTVLRTFTNKGGVTKLKAERDILKKPWPISPRS